MAALATDQQVQTYVSERLRPRCEQIRALVLAMQDDITAIDDVYAACAAQSPTWKDSRLDGPPHILAPNDVLAYNAFIHAAVTALSGDGGYPVIMKSCVRPLSG